MISPLEIAANGFNTAATVLAARNNIHTWWSGIVGCILFGIVFFLSRLYADVTLQLFFIVTGIIGWRHWRGSQVRAPLPIRHTPRRHFVFMTALTGLGALGYGMFLQTYTDAYFPYLDSLVLAYSILAQILLMRRRFETWWCWLLVNTVAVPVYLMRGLYLTAVLYAAYWLNALWALRRWRTLCEE